MYWPFYICKRKNNPETKQNVSRQKQNAHRIAEKKAKENKQIDISLDFSSGAANKHHVDITLSKSSASCRIHRLLPAPEAHLAIRVHFRVAHGKTTFGEKDFHFRLSPAQHGKVHGAYGRKEILARRAVIHADEAHESGPEITRQ